MIVSDWGCLTKLMSGMEDACYDRNNKNGLYPIANLKISKPDENVPWEIVEEIVVNQLKWFKLMDGNGMVTFMKGM